MRYLQDTNIYFVLINDTAPHHYINKKHTMHQNGIEAVFITLEDGITAPYKDFVREWTTQNIPYGKIKGVSVHQKQDAKAYMTPYGLHNLMLGRETHKHISTLGEVGCFLAHRQIWQYAVDKKVGVIVCEDGCTNYESDEIRVILSILQRFECVFMHTFEGTLQKKYSYCNIPSIQLQPNLVLDPILETSFSTKMYYISPSFSQHLLERSVRFDLQVDAFILMEAVSLVDTYGSGQNCTIKHVRTRQNLVRGYSVGACKHGVVLSDTTTTTTTRSWLLYVVLSVCIVLCILLCVVIGTRVRHRPRLQKHTLL